MGLSHQSSTRHHCFGDSQSHQTQNEFRTPGSDPQDLALSLGHTYGFVHWLTPICAPAAVPPLVSGSQRWGRQQQVPFALCAQGHGRTLSVAAPEGSQSYCSMSCCPVMPHVTTLLGWATEGWHASNKWCGSSHSACWQQHASGRAVLHAERSGYRGAA